MTRANNKLCPQGWAWLIGDCDQGQNCGICKMPEAPSLKEDKDPGERVFTQMFCKETRQDENQIVVKESESGITLRCAGCQQERGYEIGFFAHLFNPDEAEG